MSDSGYHSSSKFLGAVGENNTIIQIINSGAELVRGLAGRILGGLFSRQEQGEIDLLRERNNFLRQQVEIEQQRAAIEKQVAILEQEKFTYQQLTDAEDARRQEKLIKLKEQENQLKEQENQLYQQEIELRKEFYHSFVGLMQEYQQNLLRAKAEELQAKWDLYNLPFHLSREETLSILQTGHGLLILLAPPKIPNDVQGFAGHLEKEIEDSLKDTVGRHYSLIGPAPPVEFYRIFKRPIEDIEALHVRELFVRPTLILSSTITDQRVYITVTCPINPNLIRRSMSDNQTVLKPWNWEELVEQLESDGKTRKQAIRAVRELITVFHIIIAGYFADLYYLSFNPFHEPKLFELIKEFPPNVQRWLQPYQIALEQTQLVLKTQTLQGLATQLTIEGDYSGSIQAYQELIRLQPSMSKFHYQLGDMIYKFISSSNDINVIATLRLKAIASYLSALELDNFHIRKYNYKSAYNLILLAAEEAQYRSGPHKLQLYKIVLKYCDKILALAKGVTEIADFARKNNLWLMKAVILLKTGELQLSLRWFEQALIVEPHRADVWIMRATVERNMGLLDKASISIGRAFIIQPSIWTDKDFQVESNLLLRTVAMKLRVLLNEIKDKFIKVE